VRTPALGEAATQLPWLTPAAASLVALARAPSAAAWDAVCSDPGCVLLLIREAFPRGAPAGVLSFPAMLGDPAVLEGALRNLARSGAGFVDWSQPPLRPVYHASLLYARSARLVAERADGCAPDNAWVAGLLAPLGWLAAAAVDPASIPACLHDPDGAPGRLWGMDPTAIARRLCHAWRLPPWLTATCGHLALPPKVAQALGADLLLFQVVQLAVGLVQELGAGLGLVTRASRTDVGPALAFSTGEVGELRAAVEGFIRQPPPFAAWESPTAIPLLPDLLRLAAENRRLQGVPALELLQSDVDKLQAALVEQRRGEHERLQALKLNALAELAAGAGHEINNPLAVISGQAQYLLMHEQEPVQRRALQVITGQAQRIHQILTELMQFARPPIPRPQAVDVAGLVRDVTASLQGPANERQVRLVCPEPATPVAVHADPAQARTALGCLLRNAIEAAPAEGWAGIRVEDSAPGVVDLVVEDNGRGLTPAERDHVFDPFYSGRKAGRGRGLGLPTAWRLARQHAGDVRFDASCQTLTRFVLSLPKATPLDARPAVGEPAADRNRINGCAVPAGTPV
jgi:signal transduction histidine kinase